MSLGLRDFAITAAENSSLVSFNTDEYARAFVYWGETSDYEKGTISGVVYQKTHLIKIESLKPDTEYFLKMELVGGNGVTEVYTTTFLTKEVPGTKVLQSIQFGATARENSIALTWSDFSESGEQVRILRSAKFFPVDPYDGKVVYQGAGERGFVDTDVVPGVTYYYTLFVLDEFEHYSSGSVAKAAITQAPTPVFDDIDYSPAYEDELMSVDLMDFSITQDGEIVSLSQGGMVLDGDANIEITIPKSLVPLGIKAISISIFSQDYTMKADTYLLTLTPDGQYYKAVIGKVGKDGVYTIEINFFDTSNQLVKTIRVVVQVEGEISTKKAEPFYQKVLEYMGKHPFLFILILLLGFIGGLIARLL
jgi:hypothetical protein